MGRTEMVNARTEQLKKLNDIELVNMIVGYFKENATLPGEKSLKEYALGLKGEFDGSVITGLMAQVRDELIETFASLLVKEVRLKNVNALNENKKNKDAEGLKASDLPMVLTDVTPIPVNTIKNSYEMNAFISSDADVCMMDGSEPTEFAQLPKGFKKNHRGILGMQGTVVASDYSNGKFANMGYKLLIDLGQWLQPECTPAAAV